MQKIADFDFDLPETLIAQQPSVERDGSRMLVVDRALLSYTDCSFVDFPNLLTENDVLVLNNTKVFPARLLGSTETGAKIEIFLIEEEAENLWTALARPGRRLALGKRLIFGEGLVAEVIDKLRDGKVLIRFQSPESIHPHLEKVGRTPLPPYIKRDDSSPSEQDRERYQTVFASKRGAIAAPTAGLHFSQGILSAIRSRGIEILEITLHVGYGTFEPVRVEDLSEHKVAAERFEIDSTTADKLNAAKSAGKNIVAVGTTTTRALETSIERFGEFRPGKHLADLTITPGRQFKAVDSLVTNFHLPKSSLLVLVSTFAGHQLIMNSYKHAVQAEYRFFSYGDCMFIR